MQFWQLAAILSSEQEIFNKYISGINMNEMGKKEIDENIVTKALEECKLQYYTTSHNYLRLMPEDDYLKKTGVKTVEIMSVLDAYKKYGGDAITEVVDYGSFNLTK